MVATVSPCRHTCMCMQGHAEHSGSQQQRPPERPPGLIVHSVGARQLYACVCWQPPQPCVCVLRQMWAMFEFRQTPVAQPALLRCRRDRPCTESRGLQDTDTDISGMRTLACERVQSAWAGGHIHPASLAGTAFDGWCARAQWSTDLKLLLPRRSAGVVACLRELAFFALRICSSTRRAVSPECNSASTATCYCCCMAVTALVSRPASAQGTNLAPPA